MPSFAFDSGLLVPTVLGRRTSTPLTPELRRALRQYLLDVVDVDLLPISWSDEAEPVLTAMDPAGQVVTAIVVDSIDGVGLVRALARAGETAASSWLAIASRHPGGVDEFRRAWSAFRETRPAGAQPGPQLIVLAGAVDPEVLAATRVMHGVLVYSVDVREGSNGDELVDVSAVHRPRVRVLDHDVVHEPEQLALLSDGAAPGALVALAPPAVAGDEAPPIEDTAVIPPVVPDDDAGDELRIDPQLVAVASLVGAPMPIEAHTNGQLRTGSLQADGTVLVDGAAHPTLESAAARIGAEPAHAWSLWQIAGFPMADARDEAARAAEEESAVETRSRRRRH
ncbi:hypothetical protein IM660_03540 [Ruania alkalisoli]|uniref:RAMA domain-containing protein n=1 Tax=Ruania alkalisoli TaxID=2779775 RepID=A0A7M1SWQ9_9MICO|nr:hypothetical protein [Ruania alkalisoli]QOR71384.1 hypothetical protein IM660_03540 [Ruania alkalisoli]